MVPELRGERIPLGRISSLRVSRIKPVTSDVLNAYKVVKGGLPKCKLLSFYPDDGHCNEPVKYMVKRRFSYWDDETVFYCSAEHADHSMMFDQRTAA